jgi:hypothetical protein
MVDANGGCYGNSPCYTSIQQAIETADPNKTIRVIEGNYPEACVLNSSKEITLECGYDETYTSQAYYSPMNSLTIEDGTLIVKKVSIGL